MKILTKRRINCSAKEPLFIFLVAYLTSLVESCAFLSSYSLENATTMYTDIFTNVLPSNSNLDNVDFNDLFKGNFSKQFTLIFKRMILTWEKLQEEEASKQFTFKKNTNSKISFLKELKIFDKGLKQITKELKVL